MSNSGSEDNIVESIQFGDSDLESGVKNLIDLDGEGISHNLAGYFDSEYTDSTSWSLSWYLLASSAMHLESHLYCSGLEPGILRHHMRSLGLLSLLSADHIPPSFSLWFVSFAFRVSFLYLSLVLSRCLILFVSRFPFHLRSLFVSRSGWFMIVLRSFWRRLECVSIL